MQTANPVLSNKTFDGFLSFASPENAMTVSGTVNKTGVLLVCVLASAAWTWGRFSTANPAQVMPYLVLSQANPGRLLGAVHEKTRNPSAFCGV